MAPDTPRSARTTTPRQWALLTVKQEHLSVGPIGADLRNSLLPQVRHLLEEHRVGRPVSVNVDAGHSGIRMMKAAAVFQQKSLQEQVELVVMANHRNRANGPVRLPCKVPQASCGSSHSILSLMKLFLASIRKPASLLHVVWDLKRRDQLLHLTRCQAATCIRSLRKLEQASNFEAIGPHLRTQGNAPRQWCQCQQCSLHGGCIDRRER
mmetsp:Transcript_89987/g.263036  ORF Transcript_89987/g.263036 Transcript_89987/m.263036 type:complete len:209 (+) Transcript_89987:370-996(+)